MEWLCLLDRIKKVLAEANVMDSSLSRTYVYLLFTGDFRVVMSALAINHDRLGKHQGGVGTAALDACSPGLQACRHGGASCILGSMYAGWRNFPLALGRMKDERGGGGMAE